MDGLEVVVKEFNGSVEASFKRGKRLDPVKERVAVVNGLYRVLENPDKTLTLVGKRNLVNAVITDGKLVIVKGFKPKGIVPARSPVEGTPPETPKAPLDTVKEFLSKEELGLFYVIPVVSGDRTRPATVEDLAKGVGKNVKVRMVVGTDFGSIVEFEVGGVRFRGNVHRTGKGLTARSVIKELTCEAVKELEKLAKKGKFAEVYKVLSGKPLNVKKSIEVKNVVRLAGNFRCGKELGKVKKKLFSMKFTGGKLKLAVSRFIEEYEEGVEADIEDDHVLVKVAYLRGKVDEADQEVGYAVLSKGRKTVFTGDAEVVAEEKAGKMTLYIVRAKFGHVFKDTKIVNAIPLTFGEMKEVEEGLCLLKDFLTFLLKP